PNLRAGCLVSLPKRRRLRPLRRKTSRPITRASLLGLRACNCSWRRTKRISPLKPCLSKQRRQPGPPQSRPTLPPPPLIKSDPARLLRQRRSCGGRAGRRELGNRRPRPSAHRNKALGEPPPIGGIMGGALAQPLGRFGVELAH